MGHEVGEAEHVRLLVHAPMRSCELGRSLMLGGVVVRSVGY